MKYPHESFPETRTLFNSMRIGNCEVTQRIMKKELEQYHEPSTLTGIKSFPESSFKSPVLRHIAQKYDFFPRVLCARVDYTAASFEINLGNGVKLLARAMNPTTLQEDPTEKWFYLTLLYLDKNEYDGRTNALKKVKEFVAWIEEMKSCPIKTIYFRPFSITDQKHFEVLPMVKKPNATTERLRNAYVRVWDAKEMKITDVEGEYYYEIPFRSVSYVA